MPLIGPMPKHPDDPELPTPWKIGEGEASNRIYAANDRLIAEIEIAGITWKEDEEVALEIAKAVNRAFEPATVRSELRSFHKGHTMFAFEVEQGWAVYAASRNDAETQFADHKGLTTGFGSYGTSVQSLLDAGWSVV